MLSPTMPPKTQKAALEGLRKINHPTIARLIAAHWSSLGPVLKMDAVDLLLARTEQARALIGLIENGTLPAGQINTAQQQTLLQHADESIQESARRLFAANPDRQRVLQAYASAEKLPGSATKGRELFLKNCAACHRLHEVGTQVGPDLGMMADKPFTVLLTAVLDPNQAMETRYVGYTATTLGDRDVSGILATETAEQHHTEKSQRSRGNDFAQRSKGA